MPAGNEITKEWLAQMLPPAGYNNIRFGTRDPECVLGEHPTRPNLTLKVRRDLKAITIVHSWALVKLGWGDAAKVATAVAKANSLSWLDTFSQDNAGNLNVSSYITLAEQLTEADVAFHIEKEASLFLEVINAADLRRWIK
jgi:hypothetical protein